MDQDQNRHHPHDKGYKYLLSSKKTFMELVFDDELLNFQYFLIDVHRYTEDELSQLSNLIGAVFSLDQVEEMSELRQKLTTLTVQLQRLSDEQLHQFSLWVQRIFKWRLPFDAHRAIDELAANLQRQGGTNDMLTNFERVLDELIEQKMAEGEAKGIEKGMAKGIAKAKEDIAKEMLVTGMPLEQIMRLTKLSRERLEQLRKKRH